MSADIKQMMADWAELKKREHDAVEARRIIEDVIVEALKVPADLDGVSTYEVDTDVTLKLTGRIDRKVDGDKLQALAKEHGLEDHLSTLFRWKPEINVGKWKNTDEKITKPLAGAVTSKPGRPSFALITNKKET